MGSSHSAVRRPGSSRRLGGNRQQQQQQQPLPQSSNRGGTTTAGGGVEPCHAEEPSSFHDSGGSASSNFADAAASVAQNLPSLREEAEDAAIADDGNDDDDGNDGDAAVAASGRPGRGKKSRQQPMQQQQQQQQLHQRHSEQPPSPEERTQERGRHQGEAKRSGSGRETKQGDGNRRALSVSKSTGSSKDGTEDDGNDEEEHHTQAKVDEGARLVAVERPRHVPVIVSSSGTGGSQEHDVAASGTVIPQHHSDGPQENSWGPPVYTPVFMGEGNPDDAAYANYEFPTPSPTMHSGGHNMSGDTYFYGGGSIDPSTGLVMPDMTPTGPPAPDFFPQGSRNREWMGRSLETLILGFGSVVPVLCLPEDEDGVLDDDTIWGAIRRRSTVSTLGSDYGRRSSLGSVPGSHGGGRRGSLVGSGRMHGGTLANFYNRRRGSNSRRGSNQSGTAGRRGSTTGASRRGSASHGHAYHRRRLSISRSSSSDSDEGRIGPGSGRGQGGPNIALSLLAREITGRLTVRNVSPAAGRLRSLGGDALFNALDRPAGGMCSEVGFLSEVIASGDWAETQIVISRISPRLIGDPSTTVHGSGIGVGPAVADPNLPPTASRFYAGGGRVGLERDAFVLAGGVEVLIRVFREPSFVGAEMARTYDARDLSEELVSNRLAPCWNEALACLRELVYSMPSLVENEIIFDDGEFLPFLFTLLSHDSCFDGAAALVEEILSLQSHSPPQPPPDNDDVANGVVAGNAPTVRVSPPTTFFLGNVPDLYKLWSGFTCRQLAHFCRILALLVFEPEDRQLLESPAVLKSIELLQLRRNRASRAGRDSTVDMNQAILLGDEVLVGRLLQLLKVMNFAPSLRRTSPFHVMAHYPYIADTLVMLGLHEFDNWQEIDRLETLARTLLSVTNRDDEASTQLGDLGSVADMLESLASVLIGNQGEPTNQLGHIIHVISAAQQAGVVVGRPRQSRSRRRNQELDDHDGSSRGGAGGIESLASAAGILSDQMLARRFYSSSEEEESERSDPRSQSGDESHRIGSSFTGHPSGSIRSRINSPEDASNVLQFNALLLGPYQVEVLFVLCTLLGGRRKMDAQEILKRQGVIPILEDMFQRLPWDSLSPTRQPIAFRNPENQNIVFGESDEQPTGIHGPGCECTPESALCVQYLRLLHNFCDRDCDNYSGRRLLLSSPERRSIFECSMNNEYDMSNLFPGLLSKVVAAFVGESDESPYRFWLASCVESYLRGSSPAEQIFVARTGLLEHLVKDITSERLHCAGSLQTSFDLLGELCKGNTDVLRLLVRNLDEVSFRKLMSVAAANLVDSNVFIRSVLLSLERISSANNLLPLHINNDVFTSSRGTWKSANGAFSRSYLTHSWWDTCPVNKRSDADKDFDGASHAEEQSDMLRPSDWFPTMGTIDAFQMKPPETAEIPSTGLHDGVGHFGWVFTPEGESLSSAAHAPNTLERLSWFLAANQTRLLRDLLEVVDLRNINHENICCLNTAVVIAIFAYRRQHLHVLLQDLKRMNAEEMEHKRRAETAAAREDDVIDRAFVQAMRHMDLDRETRPVAPYARRASLSRRSLLSSASYNSGSSHEGPGDGNDVMRNFREVLWFWIEYYTHRGRDRLSLEFSSHIRFQEWIEVVSLLGADNGSPTSLVQAPLALPRSPYHRAA